MFTPVITSRKAQDHFNMVKGEYANIIQGMNDQNLRRSSFDQQKKVDESEKKKLDTETNMNNVANMQKREELELKRLAITTP